MFLHLFLFNLIFNFLLLLFPDMFLFDHDKPIFIDNLLITMFTNIIFFFLLFKIYHIKTAEIIFKTFQFIFDNFAIRFIINIKIDFSILFLDITMFLKRFHGLSKIIHFIMDREIMEFENQLKN